MYYVCQTNTYQSPMKPIFYLFFSFLLLLIGCEKSTKNTSTEPSEHFTQEETIEMKRKARSYRDTMWEYYDSSLFVQAIKFAKFELPLREKLQVEGDIVDCLVNMADAYMQINNDSAFFYLKKAEYLLPQRAYTQNQLGLYFCNKGLYIEALKYFHRGYEFALNSNDKDNDRLRLFINLSNTYNDCAEYEQSILYADKGLSIYVRNQKLLHNKANAQLGLKYYDEAIETYQSAISINTDAAITPIDYISLGIAKKYKKDYLKSTEFIKKGARLTKDKKSIATAFNNLADILLLQNRTDSAFHYYQKAITTILPDFKNNDWKANPDTALFKKALSQPDLMGYLRDKANALKTLPQYGDLAIETYTLADSACDVIRKNSEVHESKLFWREKAYPLYREAIKLCYRMGKKEEAYRFFEKSRAILLLDKLNENVSKTELSTATSAVEILPQDLLQQQLNEDELFIEYFTPDDEENKDSVFVFTVSKQSSDFKKLYFPKDSIFQYQKYIYLNPQKRAVTDHTSIGHLESYLFETLLKPLGIKENTHKLIISTDGILQSLPFETLKSNSGKYLIYDYAVQYAYSVSTLYLKRPHEQKPSKNLLCIAPIEFGNYKDITLQTLTETKEQSDFFDRSGNVVLTEKQAVKQAFIQTAQEVQVIQLLTHASASGTEPCIYFYDSLMTLNELYKQHFPAALAVLTACETAIGTDAKGEGVLSLAHGFAYSGVPATVATLWKVSEEHTLSINQSFYENLQNGMSKSEALRKAKCDFISSNPALSNPYYWAAPILYGDDSAVVLSGGFNWWWVVACIGIIGFIVFLGYLKVHQLKKY